MIFTTSHGSGLLVASNGREHCSLRALVSGGTEQPRVADSDMIHSILCCNICIFRKVTALRDAVLQEVNRFSSCTPLATLGK